MTVRVVLRTPGYNCFAVCNIINKPFIPKVKFSPFPGGRLAVAGSQNFGMKGPGRLYIFKGEEYKIICSHIFLFPLSRQQHPLATADHPDGLFDVAWSEGRPDQLVAASANGQVVLWTLLMVEELSAPNNLPRMVGWYVIAGHACIRLR